VEAPLTTPEAVLKFWFGHEPSNQDDLIASSRRWSAALDQAVRDEFGESIARAIAGELDQWTDSREGTLALVLLLDQFPRHAFRGSANQYDGDARALDLVLRAWREGWPHELLFRHAIFMLMPLAHSENLEHHRLHLELAPQVTARAPEFWGELGTVPESQALKYHALIVRFGRFPHRNAILGRTSTPEELEWIEQGGPERMAPDFLRSKPV
jgi:uncharacterized protein (DUF924 family)